MKRNTPNAAQIWKQFEDVLAPRLQMTAIERAVYSHLVRHSRLEGRRRFAFSIAWLARGTHLSCTPVRAAIRRLAAKGALRIICRSKAGHVVQVLLPGEIRMTRKPCALPANLDLEGADFMANRELRNSIHLRECGRCFYCLRQITAGVKAIDHVVPRAHLGANTYRNLVSCCMDCNAEKGELTAEDFLRRLYRERRLKATELAERLRAVEALAAGKLKPPLAHSTNRVRRIGRPPLNP